MGSVGGGGVGVGLGGQSGCERRIEVFVKIQKKNFFKKKKKVFTKTSLLCSHLP